MATYIQGITDYIPQIQPFQPDYNFLSNILQTKQSRYDAAHKQLSSLYGTMLNSPMLRDDNIQARDEFFKTINQDIQRMSGLDLSLQQNIDAAQQVFKGLYEDKNIVKDMTYTRNLINQREKGQMLKTCTDVEKCGGTWWEGGDQYLDYKAQEFKNATKDEALNFQDVQYIAAQPIMEKAMKLAKDSGFNIKWDEVQGDWIVSHKNGKEMVTPLAQYFMATFGSDPKIMAYKSAQAYVTRKSWVNQNLSNYASEDEANVAYIDNLYENTKAKLEAGKKITEDTKEVIEGERGLLAKQIKESGFFETDDFLEDYNNSEKEYEAVSTASSVYAQAEDAFKAYGLNRDNLKASLSYFDQIIGYGMINQEAMTAATAYANLTAEQSLKENPYAKMAKEHAFQSQRDKQLHGYMRFNPLTGQEEYVPGILAYEAEYKAKAAAAAKGEGKAQQEARADFIDGKGGLTGAAQTALKANVEGAWNITAGDLTKSTVIKNNAQEINKLISKVDEADKNFSQQFFNSLATLAGDTGSSATVKAEVRTFVNKLSQIGQSEKNYNKDGTLKEGRYKTYLNAIRNFRDNKDSSDLINFLNDPANKDYSNKIGEVISDNLGVSASNLNKAKYKNLIANSQGLIAEYSNSVNNEKEAINSITEINKGNNAAAEKAVGAEIDNAKLADIEKATGFKDSDLTSEVLPDADNIAYGSNITNLYNIAFKESKKFTNKHGFSLGTGTGGSLDPVTLATNSTLNKTALELAKKYKDYFKAGELKPAFSIEQARYQMLSPEQYAYKFFMNSFMDIQARKVNYINNASASDKSIRNIRSEKGGKTTASMAAPMVGSFRSDESDPLVLESFRNFNLNSSNVKVTWATEGTLTGLPEEEDALARNALTEIINQTARPVKGKPVITGKIGIDAMPAGMEGYTRVRLKVDLGEWLRSNTAIPQAPNRALTKEDAAKLMNEGLVYYIKDSDWEGEFTRDTELSATDINLRAGKTVKRSTQGGDVSMKVMDNGQHYVTIDKKYFNPETQKIETEPSYYILNPDITANDFLDAMQKELVANGEYTLNDFYSNMARYGTRQLPGQ